LHVRDQGDGLSIRFGNRFDGTLQHWKDDDFRALFDTSPTGRLVGHVHKQGWRNHRCASQRGSLGALLV
jgi:hypothetical protein